MPVLPKFYSLPPLFTSWTEKLHTSYPPIFNLIHINLGIISLFSTIQLTNSSCSSLISLPYQSLVPRLPWEVLQGGSLSLYVHVLTAISCNQLLPLTHFFSSVLPLLLRACQHDLLHILFTQTFYMYYIYIHIFSFLS